MDVAWYGLGIVMGLRRDVGPEIIQTVTLAGLDKVYEVHCSCGFYRDFGYMWQTAERFVELHQKRYPRHEMKMIVQDAPRLNDTLIKRRLYAGRGGNPVRIVTLRIEPNMVLCVANGKCSCHAELCK